MVLGLKSKHKKGVRVRLEYIVHVQEVRPWPPSEALRSVQTVVLQWENGDQNSGSFLSVAGNSSIVFNESFLLPLTLKKDKKVPDTFKKNYLEFSLCEPRKDKGKGQVLGTAIINLADYVVMSETIGINAPINLKKSSSNSVQPALSISLERVERESTNSSPSTHLSKGAASWDNDDSEIASFTDEDASSHSSRRSSTFEYALALSPQSEKNGRLNAEMDLAKESSKNFLPSTTTDASSDFRKKSAYASSSRFPDRAMSYVQRNSVPPSFKSSPSSISFRDTDGKLNSSMANSVWRTAAHNVVANKHKSHEDTQKTVEDKSSELLGTETISVYDDRKDSINTSSLASLISQRENLDEKVEQKDMESDDSRLDMRKTPAFPPSNGNGRPRLKHVKSVQIHGSVKGSELLADTHSEGKPSQTKGMSSVEKERQETNKDHSDGTNEWEARIALLEEELMEAAAVELALYSVVTEHSSSGNKVHAPARRMSRFYNNACGEGQAKRASAARAAVSGLVLVSRACGNDVPRLTFWLSNAIMLRAIVSQTAAELAHSSVEGKKSKPPEESDDWEDILTFIIAIEKVESWLFTRIVESIWWQTFTPYMQPVVAKHSTRTTGSVTKKTNSRRNNSGSSHHELGSFSIELWKKAFKDACERLCPIRASGHECGCLSALVVLVMEQLVNRLDVAMFNAILRESDEEMPTDPVSDPISDCKVLPVPAGKSSFTAGAQLKNVIGNWSRWLSDLFGLEDNSFEDNAVYGDGHKPKSFKAFRLLHALSDLMMLPFEMVADASTRKEVCPLLGPTIIKRILNNFVPDEFCPVPIPKYIIEALNSEETSDSSGDAITCFPCSATPTRYSPPPAALMTCVGEVGSQVLQSSRLSSVKKSFNSDDELDELDSPLTSIIPDSYQSSSALAKLSLMSKEKYGRDVVRYKLLRETWKDEE